MMSGSLSMVVRTSVPPRTVATAVADAVHEVNKDNSVDNVLTLEEFVGETLTQQSFNMQLLAVFGGLALVLCVMAASYVRHHHVTV